MILAAGLAALAMAGAPAQAPPTARRSAAAGLRATWQPPRRCRGRRSARARPARRCRRRPLVRRAALSLSSPGAVRTPGLPAPSAPRAQPPPAAPPPPSTPGGEEPPAAAAALLVTARDTPSFSLSLSRRSVEAGPIVVDLYNLGEDPHDLRLERGSTRWQVPLTESMEVGTGSFSLQDGSWRLYCSLPGHAASGMEASLNAS